VDVTVEASEAPQQRKRGVIVIGGDNRNTIEQVVRALPPLDCAVLLSCSVDASALSEIKRASPMPIVDSADGASLTDGSIFVVPSTGDVKLVDGALHIERKQG
jgi:hypothetical protein